MMQLEQKAAGDKEMHVLPDDVLMRAHAFIDARTQGGDHSYLVDGQATIVAAMDAPSGRPRHLPIASFAEQQQEQNPPLQYRMGPQQQQQQQQQNFDVSQSQPQSSSTANSDSINIIDNSGVSVSVGGNGTSQTASSRGSKRTSSRIDAKRLAVFEWATEKIRIRQLFEVLTTIVENYERSCKDRVARTHPRGDPMVPSLYLLTEHSFIFSTTSLSKVLLDLTMSIRALHLSANVWSM